MQISGANPVGRVNWILRAPFDGDVHLPHHSHLPAFIDLHNQGEWRNLPNKIIAVNSTRDWFVNCLIRSSRNTNEPWSSALVELFVAARADLESSSWFHVSMSIAKWTFELWPSTFPLKRWGPFKNFRFRRTRGRRRSCRVLRMLNLVRTKSRSQLASWATRPTINSN